MIKYVSASERLAGLAVVAMVVVVLGGGGIALEHIIKMVVAL